MSPTIRSIERESIHLEQQATKTADFRSSCHLIIFFPLLRNYSSALIVLYLSHKDKACQAHRIFLPKLIYSNRLVDKDGAFSFLFLDLFLGFTYCI
jgi:hypothetical protein